MPFRWNPSRERGIGVEDLLAAPEGLYVGSDTIRLGHEYHARLGMFPIAGGTTVPTGQSATLPGDLFAAPGQSCASLDTSILYRVDAAGPELGTTDCGPDWAGDQGSSPYHNDGSNTAGYNPITTVDSTVPATTPSQIFDSERWDPGSDPEMQWNFTATPGQQVDVRLYFANRYSGTNFVGGRVFGVAVDGQTMANDGTDMSNYDIVADVGDQVGTMKVFTVTVPPSGQITIDFTHHVENPLINGIEIVEHGVSPILPSPQNYLNDYPGFGGSSVPSSAQFSTPGVDFSQARGMFYLNGKIYAGWSDGHLYAWPFNGSTLGARQDILAQGGYVLGPTWISFSNITGMFWNNGALYYTKAGDPNLYFRYFSVESELVGSVEHVASSAIDLSNARGVTFAASSPGSTDGTMYWITQDGTMHAVGFSDGALVGSPTDVGPASPSNGMLIDN